MGLGFPLSYTTNHGSPKTHGTTLPVTGIDCNTRPDTTRPATHDFRTTTSGFRPSTHDFRTTTSGFRPSTHDFRTTTSGFRPSTHDFRTTTRQWSTFYPESWTTPQWPQWSTFYPGWTLPTWDPIGK